MSSPLRSLLAWSHTGTPYRITPNKSSQTVILSAAKDLHVTACTFGLKLLQVPGGQGYTVLCLQTCKDLCIVQGTTAGNGQPAAQSKLRELRPRARATCFVPVIRKTQNNRNFRLSHDKLSTIGKLTKRKNLNRIASTEVFCGATGNRTRDTRIFSPLLYQLSYGTRFCLELPYLSIGIAKVDIIF